MKPYRNRNNAQARPSFLGYPAWSVERGASSLSWSNLGRLPLLQVLHGGENAEVAVQGMRASVDFGGCVVYRLLRSMFCWFRGVEFTLVLNCDLSLQ